MGTRVGLLASLFVASLSLAAASGCGRSGGGGGTGQRDAAASREDALFVASAPVVVPDDLGPDFAAMGISRIYVAGASLSAGGRVTAYPPPPSRISLPVTFVLLGEEGSGALFPPGDGKSSVAAGSAAGAAWAQALRGPLAEAKGWGSVTGLHLHVVVPPAAAPALASAAKALKAATSLPVSVTVPSGFPPEEWKPLVGAADEVLLFAFGRRPETGDRMLPEPTEAQVRGFPLPFRLLVAPGGYGRTGPGDPPTGRRLPDGEVDRLSEDRNLDWNFGQLLETEPGNQYNFRPRAGVDAKRTLLAADGGEAKFRALALTDLTRLLSDVGRWSGAPVRGRVFLVDGLPTDGHVVGFPALRALLSGQPVDPRLEVAARTTGAGRGGLEFVLRVANVGATTSTLTRFDNFIRLRAEDGVFTGVSAGDFDRFETLASPSDGRPAPFGRATVCKLYENFFAAGEANDAGPIRVAGARPRVFVSWHLSLTDGRAVDGPEVELALAPPPPPPPPPRKRR